MPVKAAKSFWRPCHCPILPLPTPKTRPAKILVPKSSKGPFLDNCATCGSTNVGMVRFENVRANKNLGLRSDGVAAGRFSQVVNLCHARLHMSAHACQRDGCLCAPNYYCECWRVQPCQAPATAGRAEHVPRVVHAASWPGSMGQVCELWLHVLHLPLVLPSSLSTCSASSVYLFALLWGEEGRQSLPSDR